MDTKEIIIINEAINLVKEKFKNDSSGHDYNHMIRVLKNAKKIQEIEGGDLLVISLSSLFHDFPDTKLTDEPQKELDLLEMWMKEKSINSDVITSVFHAMASVSFKGGKNPCIPSTIEAKIVQDADRLDAIGAIGIARTFTYGGSKGRILYDYENPDIPTTIKHFDDKLLKLKDLMKTETGKKLAEQRDTFMRSFLLEFTNETLE